jgi:hypothetical protein
LPRATLVDIPDKEQAALDLKEARALKLPDRRRRLQPEHGVVARGPRPGGGFASRYEYGS